MFNLEDHQVTLKTGDFLILYTDGITEAIDELEQEYGEQRLKVLVKETLNDSPNLDGDELVKIILQSVNEFAAEQPQFDDRTLFIIKHSGYEHVG